MNPKEPFYYLKETSESSHWLSYGISMHCDIFVGNYRANTFTLSVVFSVRLYGSNLSWRICALTLCGMFTSNTVIVSDDEAKLECYFHSRSDVSK